MNKIKKVSISLLLLIMTACVIYLPQLMSKQNEENMLNKTIYWDYNMRSSTKITSKQVARLYYDYEINRGNYISFSEEDYDTTKLQEKLNELFETVFGSDKSVYDYMKKILMSSETSYSKGSVLTMIDNHPIILNFILVNIASGDLKIEFTYEEKTKTLISFLGNFPLSPYDYEDSYDFFNSKFNLSVKNYYENQLELVLDEYFLDNDIVDVGNDAAGGSYFLNVYISFGISQHPKGVYQEATEIGY